MQLVVIARPCSTIQHDIVRLVLREVGGDAEGRAIQSRLRIVKDQRALPDGSRTRCMRCGKRHVDHAAVRREVEAARLIRIGDPTRPAKISGVIGIGI